MSGGADHCPSCGSLALALARSHCRTEDRVVPCGWLRCECGAVIRPDGRFFALPTSERKPR